jgi:hypothetical protein
MLFLPAVAPPPTLSNNAWWFLFHGDRREVNLASVTLIV